MVFNLGYMTDMCINSALMELRPPTQQSLIKSNITSINYFLGSSTPVCILPLVQLLPLDGTTRRGDTGLKLDEQAFIADFFLRLWELTGNSQEVLFLCN